MQTPPDFAQHGLTAIRLLGQNPAAGRATWLAQDASGQRLVVKRFSFASAGASWEAFREHEREIAVLRELAHPSIPRFVDAFHSDDAFSLVQAFIDARPLSARVSFAPGEIEHIARRILAVLDYLQARTPPVVHRDIKPDNVLLDDHGQVYLVDFGLARSVQDSTSTIAVGTPGFMPPEQMLGHRLGPQADLYALGATLVACLSGARGHAVRDYVDSTFRFDLSKLPLRLEAHFADWLARLVEPDLKLRFSDARTALAALDTPRSAPPEVSEEPSVDDIVASTKKRANTVTAFVGLTMLGTTAAVIFLSTKSETPPAPTTPAPLPESVVDSSKPEPAPPPPPPQFPTSCSSSMVLENMEFKLAPNHTALRATSGCHLTLRNVEVEADTTILEVRNGAIVQLENATLVAKRGPVVRASDRHTWLTVRASVLTAQEGSALESDREARVELAEGTVRGPRAIEAKQRSQVSVQGVQLDGEVVENGGFVLGFDAAADAAKSRQLRVVEYARGACAGVADCFSKTGYRGRVDVDVIARTRDGSIDATRVVAVSAGTVVTKEAIACIDEAMKARAVEGYEDPEVGYRVCSLGGDIMGGTQMINQKFGFFFAGESEERDQQMKRLFR
jgi:serine/threonine protein kinase